MRPAQRFLASGSIQRSNKTSKGIQNKKLLIILFIVFLISLGSVAVLYFGGYLLRSSIQWVVVPDIGVAREELCNNQRQIYPRSLHSWALPTFSPDGMYYADITSDKLGYKKALMLFKADNNQEIGKYYSRYSSLFIYCWAEDSSGIYISDYEPGSGSIFVIGGKSSKTGPVKKLLVP